MGIKPMLEAWEALNIPIACFSAPFREAFVGAICEEQGWEGQGTVSLRKDIPCALRKWNSSTRFLAPSAEGVTEAGQPQDLGFEM